ncbi:hypothetical protein [Cohnella rhizosphaerae]|uniref:hypothetical protein n=1 Tax=Cohnella rhizosphaerae TaxID=1457232 RepID=UPI0024072B72|nr:hypothetical protein [Cohnella rhizosphaerae]
MRTGSIYIGGKIRLGSTSDLKPSKVLFDEYISKVLLQTKKKFKSYSDLKYRKALLIVNESNYIGSYIFDKLMKIEMIEEVELWFADRVYEVIDEFENEEFNGYEFKKSKVTAQIFI